MLQQKGENGNITLIRSKSKSNCLVKELAASRNSERLTQQLGQQKTEQLQESLNQLFGVISEILN